MVLRNPRFGVRASIFWTDFHSLFSDVAEIVRI